MSFILDWESGIVNQLGMQSSEIGVQKSKLPRDLFWVHSYLIYISDLFLFLDDDNVADYVDDTTPYLMKITLYKY